jgi:hypothetical protein
VLRVIEVYRVGQPARATWTRAFGIALLGAACGTKSPSGVPTSAAPAAPPSATFSAVSSAPSTQLSASAVAPIESARISVGFDPRVELFSILFRIAGNPSYGNAKGPYLDAVDAHFSAFRDQAAVRDAAALRKDHGISFNAPVDFALHLGTDLRPSVPLSPIPADLDARWKGADIEPFLADVLEFRRVSGFDDFFAAHAPMYRTIEDGFRVFLRDHPIVPWFDATFGARQGATYGVIPGIVTWPMCYGVHTHHPDGSEEVRAVMFLEQKDGAFTPGDVTLELVTHEIAHTYVNPVIDARFGDLKDAAAPLFEAEEPRMRAQAYTVPDIMTKESIVRALVVMFLRDRGDKAHADKTLHEEAGRGFLWTDALVNGLTETRAKGGGKLTTDALVATTKSVFAAWKPPPTR